MTLRGCSDPTARPDFYLCRLRSLRGKLIFLPLHIFSIRSHFIRFESLTRFHQLRPQISVAASHRPQNFLRWKSKVIHFILGSISVGCALESAQNFIMSLRFPSSCFSHFISSDFFLLPSFSPYLDCSYFGFPLNKTTGDLEPKSTIVPSETCNWIALQVWRASLVKYRRDSRFEIFPPLEPELALVFSLICLASRPHAVTQSSGSNVEPARILPPAQNSLDTSSVLFLSRSGRIIIVTKSFCYIHRSHSRATKEFQVEFSCSILLWQLLLLRALVQNSSGETKRQPWWQTSRASTSPFGPQNIPFECTNLNDNQQTDQRNEADFDRQKSDRIHLRLFWCSFQIDLNSCPTTKNTYNQTKQGF